MLHGYECNTSFQRAERQRQRKGVDVPKTLQAHSNGPVLDDEILDDEEVKEAIKSEGSVHRFYEVRNTDRALLGRVGGAIAKQHGDTGFAGQVAIDLEVNIPLSFRQ